MGEATHYQQNLSGKTVAIHDGHPQQGYYKLRRGKDAPWLPVAIWMHEGELVAMVGDGKGGRQRADPATIWVSCADNPVSKADAKQAFETGSWPGDVPQIGDNSGAIDIQEEINDALDQALAWMKSVGAIKTKVDSDKAANWRSMLLDLKKRAEAEHKTEKQPHLDAGRAVDAKYKPIIEAASNGADTLRSALTQYMREEEAKQRAAAEAARKAAEEAARAEREKAAAKGLPEPEDVPLPLPEPVQKIQAGGQRGRKVGLREITRYVVNDYKAALAHVQDHPDVVAAVEKVASAMAKAGAKVPGVETVTEKVAA